MPRIYHIVFIILFIAMGVGCSSLNPFADKPARANDPALSQAHVERAKFFWAQGEVNKTIQEMEWAVAADPYNYEAAYKLGLIYLDQGQRISARRIWENALLALDDGVERPYSNAKAKAELQAALAELNKSERPMGGSDPSAILARQEAAQGGQSAYVGGASVAASAPSTSERPLSAPAGSGVAVAGTYGASAGGGAYSSQPGLPTGQGQSAAPASAYTPKPYVSGQQPAKPAASRASAATGNKPASRGATGSAQKPAACQPCGATANAGKYAVQVSSNRQQSSAKADVACLAAKGYQASIAVNTTSSGTWYVVWTGCCTSKEQAQKLASTLNKQRLACNARAAIPQK